MIDSHGRNIDYIRISITDRCNLRCTYCMPEEGIVPASHGDILTYEEIVHLSRLFASLGICKVKLTGGEPLVRRGLWNLVKMLHEIPGMEQVTVTTNGILLEEQMEKLVEAGIDGVNISLDTMNPVTYQEITRRDDFTKAFRGIEKAMEYPQIPVKINCVPQGRSMENLIQVASLARDYPVHVRFIEMMPIGMGKECEGEFLSQETMMEEIESVYGDLIPIEGPKGNGPGVYYGIEGFRGTLGFISAISHKFCSGCNRVRLTSQGFLKTCLQYATGCDLKEVLRRGDSDEMLLQIIEETIERKPIGHQFTRDKIEMEEVHTMSQIGG